ncbi:hypothetical protein NSP_3110 [Nodularia spumigena CCY9414]|nr:hypothetical protein NSP_3110 [Nodularia spumigena CCY9414]
MVISHWSLVIGRLLSSPHTSHTSHTSPLPTPHSLLPS